MRSAPGYNLSRMLPETVKDLQFIPCQFLHTISPQDFSRRQIQRNALISDWQASVLPGPAVRRSTAAIRAISHRKLIGLGDKIIPTPQQTVQLVHGRIVSGDKNHRNLGFFPDLLAGYADR